jgi:hypothetical protein
VSKVSKSKQGTGRVVVCRELGVPNSYTIEASFAGASCSGRHMTSHDFEEVRFEKEKRNERVERFRVFSLPGVVLPTPF